MPIPQELNQGPSLHQRAQAEWRNRVTAAHILIGLFIRNSQNQRLSPTKDAILFGVQRLVYDAFRQRDLLRAEETKSGRDLEQVSNLLSGLFQYSTPSEIPEHISYVQRGRDIIFRRRLAIENFLPTQVIFLILRYGLSDGQQKQFDEIDKSYNRGLKGSEQSVRSALDVLRYDRRFRDLTLRNP